MEASNLDNNNSQPLIYQGQFGEFTITDSDRLEVTIYRLGLGLVALSLAGGVGLFLWQGATATVLYSLTVLYFSLVAGLGISLWTIHIYLVPLHRTLQIFWGIGTLASLIIAVKGTEPLLLSIYHQPQLIWAIGFLFAALTGIFFKEAFCFNRLETKGLTMLMPVILLGHLSNFVPPQINLGLISAAAVLMSIFSLRKAFQTRPDDIGDKSVFEYLKQQR
ncbi:MAG: DUF2301 domain-containing membrane protein [Cyanobacteria bacterium P01_F01_bin.150]